MPLNVSKAPTSASPLWVIALFIALSETIAGTASITTDGTARIIFACFAVAFPVAVFGVFIWLLVKHTPKLYSPGQYSRDITPEIYRLGISRADSIFLGRVVAETVVPPLESDSGGETRAAKVEEVVRRFEAAVAEASITVSISPLKPNSELLHLPVNDKTKVQALLNEIFFELEPAVEPGSYDRSWVLIDEDGREFTDMGISWADGQNLMGDSRTISEVGIYPGSRLTAISKSRPRQRNSAIKARAHRLADKDL